MQRTGWMVAAVAAIVAACSSTATDKYPSVDSYCSARATAECGEYVNCGTDKTACSNQRKSLCLSEAASAQSTGRSYVPANAPGCVDKATSTYAASNLKVTPSQIKDLADLCAHVFGGNVATGGACTNGYDCKDASQVCDKGHCGGKVTKNAGDFCANPGEVCATGTFCSVSATGGGTLQCVPKLGQGQSCGTTAPCLESLRCVGGACQPRAQSGQSCATNDDCDPSVPFCDTFNGSKCKSGEIFDSTDTALCATFGGTAGTPQPTPDAGPPVLPDSGSPAADASGD